MKRKRTKTNELDALLKKMIGKPMTKGQREELERLKNKSNVVYGRQRKVT
jgi:hypothetical protein